jgi:hypothetical protein
LIFDITREADMTNRVNKALAASRAVLRTLIVLNLVAGAAFVAGLLLSFIAEAWLLEVLAKAEGADKAQMFLHAFRAVFGIAVVAVPLGHLVLTRLLAIVETVREGDPFVGENARRLTVIAWGLLGLQLLDLLFGAVSISVESEGGPLSGWTLNLTGWIAILLLFVLARVFEQGARMREDIEGTV